MSLTDAQAERVARRELIAGLQARAAQLREQADRHAAAGNRRLAAAQRRHALQLTDRARGLAA